MCLITGKRTTKQRATVLRTDQEIAAALDIDSDLEDELLSTAGSITDLSRWIGGELQLGKRILRIQSLEKVFSRKKKGKSLINCLILLDTDQEVRMRIRTGTKAQHSQ
jgi:hypothetical protein